MNSENSRDRMTYSPERQLLQRAQKGDQAAFSAAWSRYVDPVYDFSLALLGNEALAASATARTFADAAANVHAFARSTSPLAWLLSSARKRCAAEAAAIDGGRVYLDSATGVPPGTDAIPDEELLAAARSLGMERHALLDLQLRQRLAPAELALSAGISAANGDVLAGRIEQTVAEDLHATLLASRCTSLAVILARAEVPGVRQRARELATHHVERCGRCVRADSALGNTLERYAALPHAVAPAATRAMVHRSVLQGWHPRGRVGDTWRLLPSRPARGLREHRLLLAFVPLAATAAALTMLLALPTSPLAVTRDRQASAAAVVRGTGDLTPTPVAATTPPSPPAATPVAVGTAPPTPTASPTPGATATPVPSPTPTPTPTRTAAATATPQPTATPVIVQPTPTPVTPEPTPTPTPCTGTIEANVSKLVLLPGVRSSFVLFNAAECASAAFVIAAPTVAWFQIETRVGSIPPLRSATIFLLGDPLTPSRTTMHITGPTGSFTIEIEVK